jgi:hypothetical protein
MSELSISPFLNWTEWANIYSSIFEQEVSELESTQLGCILQENYWEGLERLERILQRNDHFNNLAVSFTKDLLKDYKSLQA